MEMKKAMLVILDGWGLGKDPKVSAIDQANTPVMDALVAKYPHAELITFGTKVGLPEGQMGNSEVGHLNIGAGRIVYQELARINKAVEDRTLHTHKVLLDHLKRARDTNQRVHLMGLVSDGGVHSHVNHLLALLDIVEDNDIKNCFVHAFTDGRDVSPTSGINFIKQVEEHIKERSAVLATVVGRYYAMDRDKRWERIAIAYNLLVNGKGELSSNFSDSILKQYEEGITDEFLNPIQRVDESGKVIGSIKDGDLLICFNFRTDRPRQISEALTQFDFHEYNMHKLNLDYLTMVSYDSKFTNVSVMFEKDDLKNTIGEVISDEGFTQVRIAETEKYPHVTFFFSGGREREFPGEKRLMIPSPKVATYDLQPEMSAFEVTAAIKKEMLENKPNFICLNFANTDMVGHTGVMEAAIVAAQTVDKCLGEILETGLPLGYQFIVIADHGNSDIMRNPDGSPHTAHTTNMVPVIYVSSNSEGKKIKNGKLADIAPTLLNLLEIELPSEMDGQNLIESE